MTAERLILFTRYPVRGRVKTRLAEVLGAERALGIHDRLARHAFAAARAWAGEVEIRVAGGQRSEWEAWLGEANWMEQGGGSLGDRIERAVEAAFGAGRERVVVIGSDCPGLDCGRIAEAFRTLEREAVVFGPAEDGGYYLVGLRRMVPGLFDGIDWGGPEVLAQSLAKVPAAALLAPLADVDTVEDLATMRRFGLEA